MSGSASRTVRIVNPQGLHSRPAALIVRCANGFDSEVSLEIDGREANAKSIMEVMMLASPQGTDVLLTASGSDADELLAALSDLFTEGFGEAYQ
jgi:phosphotransferase system HPr (HPr) family protein